MSNGEADGTSTFTNMTPLDAKGIKVEYKSPVKKILRINGKEPRTNGFPYTIQRQNNDTLIIITGQKILTAQKLIIQYIANGEPKVKNAWWIRADGTDTEDPIDIEKFPPD